MIYPEAGRALDDIASEMDLVYAVDCPVMVRYDLPLEPSGNSEVEVFRASGTEDADANAEVIASAFSMARDSVLRTLPASFFDTPGADVYIERINGDAVGSVTTTYHGDTCGIWAMGTDTARQRGGIGRRLLSTEMVHVRKSGSRRFFLFATPAGYPLYERLGFETVCTARFWASGETHQA